MPGKQARPVVAVVLAAGKGTRMKSERAKVLHEISGRPLAAFAVDRALEVGAAEVVVVVGHQAAAVEAALKTLFPGVNLRFALQAEQKGTGHAVLQARPAGGFGDVDVVVLSGDVPLVRAATLQALVEAGAGSVSLVTSRPENAHGYGRIVRDVAGSVDRIVEQKDANEVERAIGEVNAGIYCFDGAFLSSALDGLTTNNAQGEYYLTDVVRAARTQGRRIAAIEAPHTEVSGVNDRAELASAESSLRRERNLALMRSGVTMRDPASIQVDLGVELSPDVELGPQVSLHGKTRVGAGTKIAQGCVIVDSEIGENVEVKPYSHLDGAKVGARCLIGPFARLRPLTELAEEVHIGNFTETKKARIGRGSKANHLTYLGDTVIGEKCNVGAGTITCNYDGVHKHETRLGDGVFIGSDTQLVAPVSIESGAYIGAGSTITKDVPKDALAFTRPPLTVKEGWASRRRDKLSDKQKAGK